MTKLWSIADQIEAMASAWPQFRVVHRVDREGVWRGKLRPILREYDVIIHYRVPLAIELFDPLQQQPRVRVVTPPLKPRSDSAEGRLPHVYWVADNDPILCLFDPDAGEWTPASLLSETTVPYTIDWLACYEGWRATGHWTGGGRHAAKLEPGAN